MTTDLITLSARKVHDLLVRRDISPVDLVEASITRMEKIDGAVNAVPTRCFDRARQQAKDPRLASSKLGGIPVVIKDNAAVGDVRWTSGTPIFADRIASESDRTIALIEVNGGIPLGKANLSELGGANSTNAVLGTTRNPWNTALTCGGLRAVPPWHLPLARSGWPMATMSEAVCVSRPASAASPACGPRLVASLAATFSIPSTLSS